MSDDRFRRQRAAELWNEGQKLQLEGQIERAIDRYTKSINVYPTAEAHTFRAWAYRFQNRLDDAIAECKKAVALDPAYGKAYNDVGAYLLAQGKLDEAVEWFEKAKDAPRFDQRHEPYMNLGRLYAAKGLHIRALREFEGALLVSPGEPSCVAAIQFLRGKLN